MRLAVALLLAACGGGSGKPAAAPADPPMQRTTRVPVVEDEPDDGVEVVSSHGHMEPAVVDAAIRPHHGELTECFTSRVGARRWLGGNVALHWNVKRDGAVIAVKLSESDLGAWPIEKCLLEVARTATFGKPVGGKAEFTVPLAFSATGPVSVWDEEAGKAVGTQLAKLDECAKQKGVKGGSPRGLVVTLYVGPQGKVQSVGFASAKSVLDDLWADCAEQAALAWKLPDPKGTIAKLAVKYR